MTVFRRAAAVVFAAAALTALAVPAAASGHHRTCDNGCVNYKGYTGQPGWFEAEWTQNPKHYYVRGVAKCGNGTRSTILQRGGWVTSTYLWSRATCTSSYPNLAGTAFDIKNCGTCSYVRHWVTIPAVKQGTRWGRGEV